MDIDEAKSLDTSFLPSLFHAPRPSMLASTWDNTLRTYSRVPFPFTLLTHTHTHTHTYIVLSLPSIVGDYHLEECQYHLPDLTESQLRKL